MAKINTIKNLIKEFGYIDGIRLTSWIIKYYKIGKNMYFRRFFVRGGVKAVYSNSLNRKIYIRPDTTDLILLIEFFAKDVSNGENREYQIDFEYGAGNDVSYILDCGANIGLFSLLYTQKYPNAKIVAVEPENENYKILCMNIRDNKNIIAIQGGIWNRETPLKVVSRDTGAYGFIVKECKCEEADINGISISSIICKYGFSHIDILKMDIEGSELEVITRDSKEWLEKTKILILETHERIKPGSEKIIEDMLFCNHYIEGKSNGENRIFYHLN